jgi:predicted ATPase/DNA-binding CsgD family transcriptional regulator
MVATEKRPARAGLPQTHTEIFGRETDRAYVERYLKDGKRVITVTGPGGVGKTRFAIWIAADSPLPVTFVPLAGIADPRDVLPAIAASIGAGERPGGGGAAEQIADLLSGAKRLILLDNLEHLLDAANDLRELVDLASGVTLLVTSRVPLRIEPEQVVRLNPLALPADDSQAAEIAASPAVRLFLQRAGEAGAILRQGELHTVAEIVRRLDGLPLAIELAAVKLAVPMPPDELLAQLEQRLDVLTDGRRDADARLRTLRDSIAWSYELLPADYQALFRRLAVFAGGFHPEIGDRIVRGRKAGGPYPYADGYGIPYSSTPKDENGICLDPYVAFDHGGPRPLALELRPLPIPTPEGFDRLVEQALLQRTKDQDGNDRYQMLSTIREFALEQLDGSGERDAVLHAFSAAMAAFSEACVPLLWTSLWLWWGLGRIDDEVPNIRAAVHWLQSRGHDGAELTLRIIEPLWPFWQFRGFVNDAREWYETALAANDPEIWVRAFALVGLGLLSWIQGDDLRAGQALDEAELLHIRMGYPIGNARIDTFRSFLAWRRGDYPEMSELLQRALPIAVADEDDAILSGIITLTMAVHARIERRYEDALAHLERTYQEHFSLGYQWGTASARYYTGETLRDLGDTAGAAEAYLEALERYASRTDGWGLGAAISGTAMLAVEREQLDLAVRFFGMASTWLKRVGAFLPPTELAVYDDAKAHLRGRLDEDDYAAAFQAGQELELEASVTEVSEYLRDFSKPSVPDAAPVITPSVQAAYDQLAPRERQAAVLLARGNSIKEVAAKMGIRYDSAHKLLAKVQEKWGLGSHTAIIAKVHELGFPNP